MNALRLGKSVLLGAIFSFPVVMAALPAAAGSTTLLTFDDLTDGAVLTNGYGGLQWTDFAVIGSQNPFAIDGYATGVVSPDNVLYNPYGEPATIGSTNRFDLISAYLTAAVSPGMQIEVQGFDGINLPYDRAFTVSTNGPQFITFNYIGVTEVKFIPQPGGQFVLDNLSVTQPSLLAITNSHPIDLGQVEVPTIGHTFDPVVQAIPLLTVFPGQPLPWPPFPPVNEFSVTDYLVDQQQESGGGGATAPVSANFDTNNQFTLKIVAPPGYKFHVHVPAGQTVNIDAYLDWMASNPYGYGPGAYGRTEISFGDLEGAAPGYYENSSFLGGADRLFTFGVIGSMAITNDLSFTSITLLATVPNTNVGSGPLNYTPLSDNAFDFYYTTTQSDDPGPFITLDSTNPPVNTNSQPIDLGQVVVPSIGHSFASPGIIVPVTAASGASLPPWSPDARVNDFLVDQMRTTGGGAVTPSVSADFGTNNQFTLTIAAPPGKRFHVHVPAGQSVMINASLDWNDGLVPQWISATGTVAVGFVDLEGTPPESYADYSFLSPSAESFGFGILNSKAITSDISFSAITLLATAAEATNWNGGLASYAPDLNNAFDFYYLTTQTNDPGRFVTLDSTNPPPVVPSTNTITFDDLPDMTFVPNGYGGLEWNNFEVISKSDRWAQEGYQVGIISPNNEVFNPYGAPAGISSGIKFDFLSAYLTAAVLPTLQVEVQGIANGTVAYDQTYHLSTNAPNFITFNYRGVDQVKFIPLPESQFTMDNVTVVINGFTNVAYPPVDLGDIEVPSIGHVFASGLPIWPPGGPVPLTSLVQTGLVLPYPLGQEVKDYLVDQQQVSKGGAMAPSITEDFDGSDQFVLKLTAPAGKRFVVNVPAGRSVTLEGQLDWQGPDLLYDGVSEYGTATISFDGLEGAAPGFANQSAFLSQGHNFFGFNYIESQAFSNDISFASITLTATVPATPEGSGPMIYQPATDDALMFYYYTTQTNDPGPFVSLVSSEPVPAAVGVVAASTSLKINSAIDGSSVITFAGVLQSSASPAGPFVDVPSKPQGTYIVPKDSMTAQQYFRVR